MGTKALSAELIYPSNNDVNGGTPGAGKTLDESRFVEVLKSMRADPFVLSNGTLANGGGLTLTINSGIAWIAGRYVSWGADSITLPDNLLSFIWIALDVTSGRVTGASIVDNDTTVPFTLSSECILLGRVNTSGGAITEIVDFRLLDQHQHLPNYEIFTANGTFKFRTQRALVEIFGATGGGGGGGGGGASVSTRGTRGGRGGRGGSGGYYRAALTQNRGEIMSVTIGAAGTSGAAGTGGVSGGAAATNGSTGGPGGTTTVGAINVAGSNGGAGGIAGLEDFSSVSGTEQLAMANGADGADAAVTNGVTVQPGGQGGAGGAGAASGGNGSNGGAGAAGRAGFVIFWW